MTAPEISRRLEIPIRFVHGILFELAQGHIVVSVSGGDADGEEAYQPALDIRRLTVLYVLEALDRRGLNTLPFIHSPEFMRLSETMELFGQTLEKLPTNRLLKDV